MNKLMKIGKQNENTIKCIHLRNIVKEHYNNKYGVQIFPDLVIDGWEIHIFHHSDSYVEYYIHSNYIPTTIGELDLLLTYEDEE